MLSVQVRCKAPKVLNAASAAAGYARTFAEILAFGNGIQVRFLESKEVCTLTDFSILH